MMLLLTCPFMWADAFASASWSIMLPITSRAVGLSNGLPSPLLRSELDGDFAAYGSLIKSGLSLVRTIL